MVFFLELKISVKHHFNGALLRQLDNFLSLINNLAHRLVPFPFFVARGQDIDRFKHFGLEFLLFARKLQGYFGFLGLSRSLVQFPAFDRRIGFAIEEITQLHLGDIFGN